MNMDFTCLLKNLYAGQEEIVRTGHGTAGKECDKAVFSSVYLTYMQSTSWEFRMNESQAGIKIARRNINNLRDDTTLMTEVKRN